MLRRENLHNYQNSALDVSEGIVLFNNIEEYV